jgi:hypothetical protein
MNRTAPGLLVVLLVLLAACAASSGAPPATGGDGGDDDDDSPPPASPSGGDGGGETGGIDHPTGADEPILLMEDVGGFAMVQMIATRVPAFALYGDGRVVMQGAQTLEFPGPALPPLIERTMSEDGIQTVLEAVEDTELFTSDLELRGAQMVIADATDTVFRLNANGREVTVSIYALGMLDPSFGNMDGVDPGEIEAHRVLSQLRDALMTVDTSVAGEDWEAEGWQPFEPTAFRLYVRDVSGEPREGGDLPEQVREWPTAEDPATIGEEQALFGDGTRCVVVEGDAAATWFDELSAANQMTLWTTDGEDRWSVLAKPLLPGEEPTCPAELPAGA